MHLTCTSPLLFLSDDSDRQHLNMETFKRRPGTLKTLDNARAKKDYSSGEHTPLKGRHGDEPDEICYPPSTPSPSREDEVLTEESLLSSHSRSDADCKPSSSPSSSEDEVLAQDSQSSCHSSPEKHHHHSSSSDTEIGYFSSSFHDGEQLFTTSSSVHTQNKTVTRRRHDEDDGGADEDDGSDKTSQGIENTDEKERKGRVKRQTKAVHKQKCQQDDDDWDGEDRQTTATGSPPKGQKRTAVTRECSDIDAPELEVKKQGKRPWNGRERTAVKRHLGKFIALRTVPAKQDCLMCIDKESSVLRARRWTDVKYFVYSEIVKIKRKLAF